MAPSGHGRTATIPLRPPPPAPGAVSRAAPCRGAGGAASCTCLPAVAEPERAVWGRAVPGTPFPGRRAPRPALKTTGGLARCSPGSPPGAVIQPRCRGSPSGTVAPLSPSPGYEVPGFFPRGLGLCRGVPMGALSMRRRRRGTRGCCRLRVLQRGGWEGVASCCQASVEAAPKGGGAGAGLWGRGGAGGRSRGRGTCSRGRMARRLREV